MTKIIITLFVSSQILLTPLFAGPKEDAEKAIQEAYARVMVKIAVEKSLEAMRVAEVKRLATEAAEKARVKALVEKAAEEARKEAMTKRVQEAANQALATALFKEALKKAEMKRKLDLAEQVAKASSTVMDKIKAAQEKEKVKKLMMDAVDKVIKEKNSNELSKEQVTKLANEAVKNTILKDAVKQVLVEVAVRDAIKNSISQSGLESSAIKETKSIAERINGIEKARKYSDSEAAQVVGHYSQLYGMRNLIQYIIDDYSAKADPKTCYLSNSPAKLVKNLKRNMDLGFKKNYRNNCFDQIRRIALKPVDIPTTKREIKKFKCPYNKEKSCTVEDYSVTLKYATDAYQKYQKELSKMLPIMMVINRMEGR